MTGAPNPPTVGITGSAGFLGWHLRARLHLEGIATISADRATFADEQQLDQFVSSSDVIVHVAGVNRAHDESEVTSGNRWLADRLIESMTRCERSIPVLYTNSTKIDQPGVYGQAKRAAGEQLETHQRSTGQPFVNLVLPHLFGEYGQPHYNSAVTTFAYALATKQPCEVNRNGQIELLHAQDASARIVEFIRRPASGTKTMAGTPISIGESWDLLQRQHGRYVTDGTVPAFDSRFELHMFNLLRSQLYLAGYYPVSISQHADHRGAFEELCRSDGLGQSSYSTSVPGVTRGDHYHLEKIERFVVIHGAAIIRLRRLLTNETVEFRVSGAEPVLIDMPPLTTHNITNAGGDLLGTFFWAADHFDPANPDTYPEPVSAAVT